MIDTTPPQRVVTGFVFTEGPLWHPDGYLLFTDVRDSKLYRVRPGDREATLLRAGTGGGNGLTFDPDGNVIMCEGANRRVVRFRSDAPQDVQPVAETCDGKRLNMPNDIVGHSDGSLWFSNPGWRLPESEREMAPGSVCRIMPDGRVQEMASDMPHPNGLAFSPDETLLYVSNTRPRGYLQVYDVDRNGSLSNGRVFSEMPYTAEGEAGGVPDGLKLDVAGNIYCTGPEGVWVWKPDGTLLGIIRTPELPANLAWGGAERQAVFLTCRTSVYSIRSAMAGAPMPSR